MGLGLTLTEALLPEVPEAVPDVSTTDWEVGRLALAPEFRRDVDALRQCLHLVVEYIRIYTEVRQFFAACTHVLSRLYRRFAFSVFANEVPLRGTSKTYTMIRGEFEEVSRALARRPQ